MSQDPPVRSEEDEKLIQGLIRKQELREVPIQLMRELVGWIDVLVTERINTFYDHLVEEGQIPPRKRKKGVPARHLALTEEEAKRIKGEHNPQR